MAPVQSTRRQLIQAVGGASVLAAQITSKAEVYECKAKLS
jgi:hypothetical protein